MAKAGVKTSTDADLPAGKPSVLRGRRFLPLLLANIFGGFNDNLLKNAMLVLITYEVLSMGGLSVGTAIPIAATIFTLPFFLFSGIAGQVADKYDRAFILRRVKFFEIIIAITASIGFLTDNIVVLLLALFAIGLQSCFFTPTRNAVLPQWLPDEKLVAGNAVINGLLFVFILLGTVTAVLLINTVSGPEMVSALLVGFALLGWLMMCQAPNAPPPEPEMAINFNIVTATLRVLVDAWNDKRVLRPLLGTAWFWGLSALVMTLMPIYLESVLAYDETVLLVLMITFTVGAFVGSIASMLLISGRDGLGWSAVGALCLALFCSDLYVLGIKAEYTLAFSELSDNEFGGLKDFFAAPRSSRFLFDLFGAAASAGLFVVPLQAMAQRRANPQFRARILSAGAIMNAFATTTLQLALLLIPAIALVSPGTQVPLHWPFLGIAVVSAAIGVYAGLRALSPEYRQSQITEPEI